MPNEHLKMNDSSFIEQVLHKFTQPRCLLTFKVWLMTEIELTRPRKADDILDIQNFRDYDFLDFEIVI